MTSMSIEDWIALGQLFMTFITSAFAFWMFLDRRSRASRGQFEGLRQTVDTKFNGLTNRMIKIENGGCGNEPTIVLLRERIGKIESALEHQINKDDLANVHRRIDKISEDTAETRGMTQQINQSLVIIRQALDRRGENG